MLINFTKSLAKIYEKTFKIMVQRDQNRGPEGSGQLLGASWWQETFMTLRGHLLDASGEALGADSGWSKRILEASRGPKTAQKFCQDGPRCLQDASKTAQDPIFSKKAGKNEPFEFGWHFPFDVSPILSQKYLSEYWEIISLMLEK